MTTTINTSAGAGILRTERRVNSSNGNASFDVTFVTESGNIIRGRTRPNSQFTTTMPREGRACAIWHETAGGSVVFTDITNVHPVTTYYVVKTGPDRFYLRQSRFREQFDAGREHPHDVMAAGFTAAGMREIVGKWFADTDMSALA